MPQQPGVVRRRSRKPLFIGLGIVLGLAALIGGGLIAFQLDRGDGAVLRFFEALRASDSAAALKISNVDKATRERAPADAPLLSDEVLRKSNEVAPITDVQIVNSKKHITSLSETTVTVSFSIGGVPQTANFDVYKRGSEWRFSGGVVKQRLWWVKTTQDPESLPTLRINDQEVDKTEEQWLFVGGYAYTSDDEDRFSWWAYNDDAKRSKIGTLRGGFPSEMGPSLTVEVSDSGEKLVRKKVDQYMLDCAKKGGLQPAGCPFGLTPKPGMTVDPKSVTYRFPEPPSTRAYLREIRGNATEVNIYYLVTISYTFTQDKRTISFTATTKLMAPLLVDLGKPNPTVQINQGG